MKKRARPNDLGRGLVRFFQEYLPTLRGMSPHTIHSYRDALLLLLRFLSTRSRCGIESLDLSALTADSVGQFLAALERERHNGVMTRNVRLAAVHTFVRFLATEYPEHLVALQAILAIPFKRGGRVEPIAYLEQNEVKALLDAPDQSTIAGRRDHALFALMFNTGARVQELLNLRFCDVRLQPPSQVKLAGKGNKTRICPIWPQTAKLLRRLKEERQGTNNPTAPLFVNNRGTQLTRYGVRYLLREYLLSVGEQVPSVAGKRIHPHSLRHTTAIHLLKAGVDFASISQWLGHASLTTTMRYARADIDMKRQALLQVFPDVLATETGDRKTFTRVPVTEWLKRL